MIPFTRIIFYTSIYAFFSEYSELTAQKKLGKIRFVFFSFLPTGLLKRKKSMKHTSGQKMKNYKVKFLNF